LDRRWAPIALVAAALAVSIAGEQLAQLGFAVVRPVSVIGEEIARLTRDGPSDEELQKAKDYLTGSYALGFDTSTKIAHQLAQIAFEGLGLDYIARRNALVSAVTQADVRRAAERTLDDGAMLVVVAGRPVGL
jgi:zinc protease